MKREKGLTRTSEASRISTGHSCIDARKQKDVESCGDWVPCKVKDESWLQESEGQRVVRCWTYKLLDINAGAKRSCESDST